MIEHKIARTDTHLFVLQALLNQTVSASKVNTPFSVVVAAFSAVGIGEDVFAVNSTAYTLRGSHELILEVEDVIESTTGTLSHLLYCPLVLLQVEMMCPWLSCFAWNKRCSLGQCLLCGAVGSAVLRSIDTTVVTSAAATPQGKCLSRADDGSSMQVSYHVSRVIDGVLCAETGSASEARLSWRQGMGIGIAVGVIAASMAIVLCVVFFLKRRNRETYQRYKETELTS